MLYPPEPIIDVEVPEPARTAASVRPSCLTRHSERADEAPYQVRVERDEGWCDLVEIVDEPLSSRSSKAVPTGLNGRVTLTTDEARWVRDALCQILGPEGT